MYFSYSTQRYALFSNVRSDKVKETKMQGRSFFFLIKNRLNGMFPCPELPEIRDAPFIRDLYLFMMRLIQILLSKIRKYKILSWLLVDTLFCMSYLLEDALFYMHYSFLNIIKIMLYKSSYPYLSIAGKKNWTIILEVIILMFPHDANVF